MVAQRIFLNLSMSFGREQIYLLLVKYKNHIRRTSKKTEICCSRIKYLKRNFTRPNKERKIKMMAVFSHIERLLCLRARGKRLPDRRYAEFLKFLVVRKADGVLLQKCMRLKEKCKIVWIIISQEDNSCERKREQGSEWEFLYEREKESGKITERVNERKERRWKQNSARKT